MDEFKKGKGGFRVGAGRKPIGHDKKVQITLYVPEKEIWPFVNQENLKKELYGFISAKKFPAMTQDQSLGQAMVKNLNEPTHQIKPPEQPKTNYQVNTQPIVTQPLLTKFVAFKERILKTSTIQEVEAVMKEVKSELFLTVGEKKNLEATAKEHSKNMYND